MTSIATESHSWFSTSLNQEMSLHIYGHAGKPMLAFPCQGGRSVEFADFGMIDVVRPWVEEGKLRIFTIDSVDNQSWANNEAHPASRAFRHEDYDRYVISEVLPFIRNHSPQPDVRCLTFGCSMGGYHAGNFLFRHPDCFDAMISLSGVFQLKLFIGAYMDEIVYFNSPIHYLSNLNDRTLTERYRDHQIVICTGQGAWEEPMIEDARAMQWILSVKGIPAWVDFWGHDVNHDWPWWRKQLPYFLSHLRLE